MNATAKTLRNLHDLTGADLVRADKRVALEDVAARYAIAITPAMAALIDHADPNDPIAIASKQAHDLNIVVVFAAGNSGPGKDTMNPYAKAPWVIGVAAGTKEGGLASFSSRGVLKAQRAAGVPGPPRQPGDQVAPAGGALQGDRLEPGLPQDGGQELRRRGLVAPFIHSADYSAI